MTHGRGGTAEGGKMLWGMSCFAEYRPLSEEEKGESDPRQPWAVQKYDQDWCFYLDREEDAAELIARLDARDKMAREAHPLERGRF